jgi:hypothetical protein
MRLRLVFFSEDRVRFHTKSAFFNALVIVFTCTNVPPIAMCLASSAFAVNGSCFAASNIFSNSSVVIFLGAPLRGASTNDSKPRLSQSILVNPTVRILISTISATSCIDSPSSRRINVFDLSRSRQSAPR